VWGFSFREIVAPVYLWHGQRDRLVPVEAAQALAGALPHCQATYYPREGHNAPNKHEREILTTMIADPE
jgi:pimeloyl-ACP methyl ester carboxylesterase